MAFLCPLTLAALAGAVPVTVEAPITGVTVYSDRARVVRTARLSLSGRERVVLPLLPDTVDPSTIRVEATSAEVEVMDIAHVDAREFPADEARRLLGKLEKLDDQISEAQSQKRAHAAVADVVLRLGPSAPGSDALRPPPRLSPGGWGAAFGFVRAYAEKNQARVRELDERLIDLGRQRAELAEQARLLGGAGRRSGYRVAPTLSGHGPARVALSYVINNARWYPAYDIQLQPAEGQVKVFFAGAVSQESGEDWLDATLTLSTAVPGTAAQFPRLLTWKIGERERFIPTPVAASEPPPPPPGPARPMTGELADLRGDEALRRGLLQRAQAEVLLPSGAHAVVIDGKTADKSELSGKEQDDRDGKKDEARRPADQPMPAVPAPPPPAGRPSDVLEQQVVSRNYESVVALAPGVITTERAPRRALSRLASIFTPKAEEPPAPLGLGPPPAYQAPVYAPNLPVSLAGGYDISFPSLGPETVRSGKGARRVALFSRTWPVRVERKVFPALAEEAFLVAEIRNPSAQALPGGQASLFVGADPAGVATLHLVAPGEVFTLPLGLDRAIKPLRNVKVVTTEKGVISKDEVNEYLVSTEIANPYSVPVPLRIIDQVPVGGDKNVEIRLGRVEPVATLDKIKGSLEWRVTLPPSGKARVSFTYTLRRPKGYRLHQSQ